MLEMIKPYSDAYVECVSKVSLPQTLINFQGEKAAINNYYPSSEMHQQAARLLYPLCQDILKNQ